MIGNEQFFGAWPQDDEDRKRKAEIEEMMRRERERYFSDEAVQQEYRDILDRQTAAHEAAVTAARKPGPGAFDLALARFRERKVAAAENLSPAADPAALWPLLDGGESEAKEIFRRTGEAPASAPDKSPDAHSGGQIPQDKSRFKETGVRDRVGTAKRHDDGGAADVDLYVIENGKRRYLDSKNPADRTTMKNFIRDVVTAGVTGVGHGYMRVRDNDMSWRGATKPKSRSSMRHFSR